MSEQKDIFKSKDGTKRVYIEGNTIGANLDEHTKVEIDLAKAGKMAGEKLANLDYEKLLKKIKKGGKWLKFARFLSKFKK